MHNPWDLIAIGEELYVSEQGLSYVHNVNLYGRHEARHWNATGQAANLSMTPSGNILVSHLSTNSIVEHTPNGIVVREICLGIGKIAPSHAVQLRSGLYVVCDIMGEQHRVVKLDKSGQVIKEYKVASKLEKKTWKSPRYLLKDEQDNILVADQDNDRILWMSPSSKSHQRARHSSRYYPGKAKSDVFGRGFMGSCMLRKRSRNEFSYACSKGSYWYDIISLFNNYIWI